MTGFGKTGRLGNKAFYVSREIHNYYNGGDFMFTKCQFFIGIAVSAFIAFGAGYSKARELCLSAMINAMPNENNKAETESTEE